MAYQVFNLKPKLMAEKLSNDKCPASLGVFEDEGRPTLVSIFLLPEHLEKAQAFVQILHNEAGYVSPTR